VSDFKGKGGASELVSLAWLLGVDGFPLKCKILKEMRVQGSAGAG